MLWLADIFEQEKENAAIGFAHQCCCLAARPRRALKLLRAFAASEEAALVVLGGAQPPPAPFDSQNHHLICEQNEHEISPNEDEQKWARAKARASRAKQVSSPLAEAANG